MGIGMIVLFVVVGLISVAAIVAAIVYSLKSSNPTTPSGEPAPPPRTITYTTIGLLGAQTTRQTLRGSSVSTASITAGPRARDGKVVTSLAELFHISPDTSIRLTARVSDQNPALEENLVAYIGEEFQGLNEDGSPYWGSFETATPPLLLELGDGCVEVRNNDYGLTVKVTERSINGHVQGRPMYVPQEDTVSWNEFQGLGTRRYCGLEAGDEVTVSGTIADYGDDTVVIAARNIMIVR